MQYFDGSNKVQNVRKWCYYYLMVFKSYMGVNSFLLLYYIYLYYIYMYSTVPN